VVRQFDALKQHRREDIPAFSHVDAKRRPFDIEGTWERYSFRIGNLLFLMMSDVNEPTQKLGRGPLGGNPGGVVRGETFRWWKRQVEQNPSSIIITAHHYVLKNTTVASGEWEGTPTDQRTPEREERLVNVGWLLVRHSAGGETVSTSASLARASVDRGRRERVAVEMPLSPLFIVEGASEIQAQ
jgi:hypothetical protein